MSWWVTGCPGSSFDTKGAALAYAWSITPPGGCRPKVREFQTWGGMVSLATDLEHIGSEDGLDIIAIATKRRTAPDMPSVALWTDMDDWDLEEGDAVQIRASVPVEHELVMEAVGVALEAPRENLALTGALEAALVFTIEKTATAHGVHVYHSSMDSGIVAVKGKRDRYRVQMDGVRTDEKP